MRWIAIVSFILYALIAALLAASIAAGEWYSIPASAAGGTKLQYGLFFLCATTSTGKVCTRYDKLAKADGATDSQNAGYERLLNGGIVCGFSIALALLETLLSLLCTVIEFFVAKRKFFSTCASRTGFTAIFFCMLGPLFWWFYSVVSNNYIVLPSHAFTRVQYAFWLPYLSVILFLVAGLLLELVGKEKNAVGSAV